MKTLSYRQIERRRANLDSLHAASDREFKNGNSEKYGNTPWGVFYHYVAMELSAHVTKKQMEKAIETALRSTAEQEASLKAAAVTLKNAEADLDAKAYAKAMNPQEAA